ncbi:MAG: transglycosylase domain-containing protein [Verrucomicrobiales bacterium]|nr:transglycosylase domain-containing protein [Verrucomicrobiales bacterium]
MSRDKLEIQQESGWRGPSGLKVPFYKRSWFQALFALMIVLGIAAFAAFSFMVAPLKKQAEEFDLTQLRNLEAASIIYDRNGQELSRLYMLNRTPVKLAEIPQHLIDALVSQEDSRYYEHNGADYFGMARAAIEAMKAREINQGASTITQQLARNTFNLRERSYRRKILEIYVAQRIEENFTKAQILELYLNRIYFGGGFYGVEAAANGYFGKPAKDLSIQEAATICGLIKSPNNIQPLRHPERAIKERNYVLERMAIEGYITRQQATELKKSPLITAPQEGDPRLSYIFAEVRREVVDRLGEEKAAIGGFQIYTSIDKELQQTAEQAVQARLLEVEKHEGYEHQTHAQYKALMKDYRSKLNDGLISPSEPKPAPEYLQGAALVIDNVSGSVLAMVGGRDFIDSQYNRAFYSRRPTGTAFTPFVFAAAFSTPNLFPGSQVEDAPINNQRVMIGGLKGILGEWGAEQDSQWKMTTITLREALVRSRNAATVRLGDMLGEEIKATLDPPQPDLYPWQAGLMAVKELCAASGIASPLRDYPSAFLGTSELELDEMCLAYSTFPNGGTRAPKLTLVQRITDARGEPVFQIPAEEHQPVPAMDPIAAYQTHSCLVDALHEGTGKPAVTEYELGDYTCAGKTGTHYEFKDLWFVGYGTGITTGVWVGFDKQKMIYVNAYSNRIALPIWVDIMNDGAPRFPGTPIQPPPDAERIELCQVSGMRATDFCYEKRKGEDGKERSVKATYTEYIRPGARFDAYCTEHRSEGLEHDIAAFSRIGIARLTGGDARLSLVDDGRYQHVEPVRMRGLTILGADPYNSIQPLRRAVAVNDDGTQALKAEVVEPIEEGPEELPIRLGPPPRLFIEGDSPASGRPPQ